MLYDSNGIVRKVDNKSIFDFLRGNTKPLIIYGLGATGLFTIDVLKSKKIQIVALADINRKSDKIKDIKVLSIEEIKKYYPNAMIWITIDRENLRNEAIKMFCDMGYKNNIITFNIATPNSDEYYLDFDRSLTTIIIGNNYAGMKVKENLEKENVKLKCFAELENMNKFIKDDEKVNIVICDEDNWREIEKKLHDKGIYENIYRYIKKGFGEFSVKKYLFHNVQLRLVLLKQLSYLNYIYYYLEDKTSKEILKQICKDFFTNLHNSNLEEIITLEDIEKILLLNINFDEKEFIFEQVKEDLFTFVKFIAVLNKMCLSKIDKLKIFLKDNVVCLEY